MRRIIGILLLFFAGRNAIDLQCVFEVHRWIFVSGNDCIALNVNITDGETIKSINGQTNFDGLDLKILDIKHGVVHFIPKGLGRFFPNLEALAVDDSELKKIVQKDLLPFPKLKMLSLYHNQIKFLPGNLFGGNLELKHLQFSLNPITHVGHNLLTPLKKLERVYFQWNDCMSKYYNQSTVSSFASDLRANCFDPTQVIERNLELQAKIQKLEKIIDASTRQLFALSIQQSDVKPSEPSIDLKCKMTEESCDVVDLVVELPGSKISKVQSENGTEIESITHIRIVDQATLFLPTNLAEKFSKVTERVTLKVPDSFSSILRHSQTWIF
jgi:hypothetical protein